MNQANYNNRQEFNQLMGKLFPKTEGTSKAKNVLLEENVFEDALLAILKNAPRLPTAPDVTLQDPLGLGDFIFNMSKIKGAPTPEKLEENPCIIKQLLIESDDELSAAEAHSEKLEKALLNADNENTRLNEGMDRLEVIIIDLVTLNLKLTKTIVEMTK